MAYQYEIIDYNHLPVKVSLESHHKAAHWHDDIEVLFILQGNVWLTKNNRKFLLVKGDIVFINRNEIHSIDSLGNLISIIHINMKWLDIFHPNVSNIIIQYDSRQKSDEDNRYLQNLLTTITIIMRKNENHALIRIYELLLKFMAFSLKYIDEEEKGNKNKDERITRMIQYIDTHYADDITLETISQLEYLSPQYTSAYFKQWMGISLVKYIHTIRVKKSMNDLIYSYKNITNIANEHGFKNMKSYYKAFRDIFSLTPTEYKSQHASKDPQKEQMISSMDAGVTEYTNVDDILNEYLTAIPDDAEQEKINMTLWANAATMPFPHIWKRLMNFGRAADVLKAEYQKHIRTIQADLTFEYARFYGVLCDDILVYQQDTQGMPVYRFSHVDELFDFLLECKLKPFVGIGYMPMQLASHPEQTINRRDNMSFPKDLQKWTALVTEFIRHLMVRYGRTEVLSCFEIWNAPDIHNVFWFESKKKFSLFYKITVAAIKSVDAHINVGGPVSIDDSNEPSWSDSFISFIKKDAISIDFLSYHLNPLIVDASQIDHEALNYQGDINHHIHKLHFGDKDFLHRVAKKMWSKVQTQLPQHVKMYITEFNSKVDSSDLVNDTCFMASFLAHNIPNLTRYTAMLGYWSFSDISIEQDCVDTTFHGGFGLLTNNGIKKPGYHAFQLLSMLGNQLIDQGDGYVFTRSELGYQILVYHYCHYSHAYQQERSHKPDDRYSLFEHKAVWVCHIEVEDILPGDYVIKVFKVDRENGSCYDDWIKMGSPEPMSRMEADYLKSKSQPSYRTYPVHIEDSLFIEEEIMPHGVVLIQIIKNHL